MNASYDKLLSTLRQLPGLGYRSAERIAIHLLAHKTNSLEQLMDALKEAKSNVQPCKTCGHLSESRLCTICEDQNRNRRSLCIVESVLDLIAIERSGTWGGLYHVLSGKLSPIHGVLPEHLNLANLSDRIQTEQIEEIIFALTNDIEGNATCHFIQDMLSSYSNLKFTQVGFGLPSGGGVTFADPNTLKSAFESRRTYR
jgi:recombination protein RecR